MISRSMITLAFTIAAVESASADELNPTEVYIPVDAGLVNVRSHGLKGDGITDDTEALIVLVRANLNQHRTIYFPAGTYLLSDTIDWGNDKGEYWPWSTWQGAGRKATSLRLIDNSAKFSDRQNSFIACVWV